jgi:hypothetical protein
MHSNQGEGDLVCVVIEGHGKAYVFGVCRGGGVCVAVGGGEGRAYSRAHRRISTHLHSNQGAQSALGGVGGGH